MSKKVKAFGEVMMRLEAPGHQTLEQTNTLQTMYTGTGVNILSGLCRLKHSTSIITKLPDNSLGKAAISAIQSNGISVDDIVIGGNYIGKYFLENGFGPRPTKVIYSNRKESSFCTSNIKEYNLSKILADTDLLHICGIGLAISDTTRNNVIQTAKIACSLGVKVAFDCNFRPKLWDNDIEEARKYYEEILPYVDICFMTEKDAQYILGYETNAKGSKNQINEVMPKVANRFKVGIIAGTIRDETTNHTGTLQGFMLVDGKIVYSDTLAYETLDRIGGGDGFTSGILHGVLKGLPANETVAFAVGAGVLAHTIHGDIPRSTERDIWQFLSDNRISIER
ncbi:MAG TPA: sugar kinase [Bacillota bacterium]|nr:sugar kinase [Bacillota bacterium]